MNMIQTLIAKGETEKAVKELEDIFRSKGQQEELNQLSLLKAQYSRWREKELLGLSPPPHQIIKIEAAILNLSQNKKPASPDLNEEKSTKKSRGKFFYLLGGGLALFIGGLFLFYHLNTQNDASNQFYKYTERDEEIGRIIAEDIGLNLHPVFENEYLRYTEDKAVDLIKQSKLILSDLNNIPDQEINFTSTVYKYFGLAICHKVIGLKTKSRNHQLANANQMITNGEKGIQLIKHFHDGLISMSESDLKNQIDQWLVAEDLLENLQTQVLIGLCIQKALDDPNYDEYAQKEILNSLQHNDFLQKEGYNKYPILMEQANLDL